MGSSTLFMLPNLLYVSVELTRVSLGKTSWITLHSVVAE